MLSLSFCLLSHMHSLFLSCTHSPTPPPSLAAGVVGALAERNKVILTQSMVHRTHQTIFGTHFPYVNRKGGECCRRWAIDLIPFPSISMRNWHLDDYMSSIYPGSTFHLTGTYSPSPSQFIFLILSSS